MSNKGKVWSPNERKDAFEFVFNTHFWGDRSNAGTTYQRGKNKRKVGN